MLIITDDPYAAEQRCYRTAPLPEGTVVSLANRDGDVVCQARVVSATEDRLTLTDLVELPPGDRFTASSSDAIVAWAPGTQRGSVSPLRPEQQQFRERLLKAYDGRCALTGCDEPCVLEAAHLVGWHAGNEARDGILLRADLHRLMEIGMLTIKPDYTVRVTSPAYAEWDGGKLRLPRKRRDWPRVAG